METQKNIKPVTAETNQNAEVAIEVLDVTIPDELWVKDGSKADERIMSCDD